MATRHNFGFLLLDRVSDALKADPAWTLKREQEVPGLGRWEEFVSDEGVCRLLWPLTFMNLSGRAVESLIEALAEDDFDSRRALLVLVDDLSLPLGKLRIRSKGSSGGHNGLKSLEAHLGHSEYSRLKLGIGRPGEQDTVIDFVLEPFTAPEMSDVEAVLEFACARVLEWVGGSTVSDLSQSVNGWTAPVQSDAGKV